MFYLTLLLAYTYAYVIAKLLRNNFNYLCFKITKRPFFAVMFIHVISLEHPIWIEFTRRALQRKNILIALNSEYNATFILTNIMAMFHVCLVHTYTRRWLHKMSSNTYLWLLIFNMNAPLIHRVIT